MPHPFASRHSPSRDKVLSTLILAIFAAYDEGMTYDEVQAIGGAAWGDWREKVSVSKIYGPGNYN